MIYWKEKKIKKFMKKKSKGKDIRRDAILDKLLNGE